MFKNRAPVAQSNRYDGPAQSSAKGSGKSKSKESFAMWNKRKRKAPTQVLDTMNKSISKDANVKYRKALSLSWNNVESRIVQLALGLYGVIPYVCCRLQTAVTISNQLAKVRVNWAFIATLDYCAFWYHVFQNHIQKGRGFSSPGGLQHQIGHRDKPTMLVGADTMAQSNVNTFMSNFTGDRNLGSKVICPVCPRYDIALPVDNNDAQLLSWFGFAPCSWIEVWFTSAPGLSKQRNVLQPVSRHNMTLIQSVGPTRNWKTDFSEEVIYQWESRSIHLRALRLLDEATSNLRLKQLTLSLSKKSNKSVEFIAYWIVSTTR